MSELADRLSALLREPVRRPEDAERAAKVAEALADLLRASEKAEQILGGQRDNASVRSSKSLAGKTLQDAAEVVLEESGSPLHAKELGKRMKARGWSHPRGPSGPDQIVHQLAARLPKYPRRFRRVAPNTFGLAKWSESTAAVSPRLPRVGLFSGPGGDIARQIGESPDVPPGVSAWRSS